MKLFRIRRPPVPSIVEESKSDPADAVRDLNRAVNTGKHAAAQDVAAQDAVESLARSRIRNGFAPIIEASINRHLGGAV